LIRSFADRDTRRVYEGQPVARFRAFAAQAERRLQILDSAMSIRDLAALPSNRFEPLHRDRRGQFSIRINRQWRVCLRWDVDGPFDAAIVDYH
jgi:proteic killer suppression protein